MNSRTTYKKIDRFTHAFMIKDCKISLLYPFSFESYNHTFVSFVNNKIMKDINKCIFF